MSGFNNWGYFGLGDDFAPIASIFPLVRLFAPAAA